MGIFFRPRIWYFIVALSCASLLAYGYYVQYVAFLEPCPLCIFQRIVFMWLCLVGIIAGIHGAGPTGRWVYCGLITAGGLSGIGIAWRHLWLQSLPPDQVPECGMGLNYMIDTMPFHEVLATVFRGSGECASIDWTFLGLSMPGWTLIWYIGLTAVTIFVTLRAKTAS